MTTSASSIQFSDPQLVAIFDTINQIRGYKDFYLRLADELAPRSILDIGCGTGLLTFEFAKKGYRMIGLEPSKPLLDRAKLRPGCENVTWLEGYVDGLGDTQADLAIMTGHVAQFFLDEDAWYSALGRIHKALSPNGHLAFESRNPLIPPFADWPTFSAPHMVTDPVAGEVRCWFKLLENKDGRVKYELHYHFVRSGEKVVSTDELAFRSAEQISRSLSDTGFSIENIYGNWDSSPVVDTSPEMIFIARRLD